MLTTQNIPRQTTDPKVCCDGGYLCGELAGCGFGIFKGVNVTACTCTTCIKDCCCCLVNLNQTDCVGKFCAMTCKLCACSGITTGMAVAGGLTGALSLGSLGYACANQEQRSRYFSNDGYLLAESLCFLKATFSDSHNTYCPADQEESASGKDSGVIDNEPLPNNTHLPASLDSMAPPPHPPLYEHLDHAPPAYEEAINPSRNGARE
ncbi:hypothetical protein [Endozoicomonas sp. ONNA2]|uniref:hypothetical protein n=1 Tax=Endozoicomonas sp. ONNA2 TaxID=2828741 RepID=UPI0021496FC6|nr:hypothetical protein [Endozoicomonas sp. ONNA2]